ncbi:response regulator transcription factor [Clostridium formicaceticum]|uniref:Stage 0 sporulation protein A homolog n=1 Tax=Clostridium formicaceticum TaxID=1497 RepID=A0AAC9RKY2_9CLOT|nr:response regulator [Clostridium formicaceticum]AOY74632.1 hypothetical protein BJL90_00870 [Clostridium formicaceticum]ARE88999.1 Transcriptional regulatory protein DegU [Clostridium formicaceticum]
MIKVLIADDEILVRIGLKSTIDWETEGYELVGEAQNGQEAVALFEQYDPDILMTDIKMPVMDGIELIKTLKERKPDLKCIILSHYNDFEYAQEALNSGANRYILKSDLKAENLLITLKKVSAELDQKGRGNIRPKSQIDTTEFFDDLMYNNDLKRYGSLFLGKYYVMAIGSIKKQPVDLNRDIVSAIENVAFQLKRSNSINYISKIISNKIYYLFHYQKENSNTDDLQSKKIISYLTLLRKNIRQYLDLNIMFAVSREGNSFDNVSTLYYEAIRASQDCFFDGETIVVYHTAMDSPPPLCPKLDFKMLKNYITLSDKKSMNAYINSFFNQLFHIRIKEYVEERFIDFLSFAKVIMNQLGIPQIETLLDEKLNYTSFSRLYTFNNVRSYVLSLYETIIDRYTGDSSEKYSYVMRKSIQYIKENYAQNLTLSSIAAHVEISNSYLSLLFKQETGVNLITYITNYRIEKAKELLLTSNCKIYEIAQMVGFENSYYFSKVFKEITGMTCKQYKNRME